MKSTSKHASLLVLLAGLASLPACQSDTYTSSMSLSGTDHQRDLSDTVRDAIAAHEAAREAFAKALQQIDHFTSPAAEVDVELHAELRRQVDRCADRVETLQSHHDLVQMDGATLFANWNMELAEFANPKMRDRSEKRMQDVYRSFDTLLSQLNDSSERMDASLVALRDYVLFFNHNLTAAAIASLEDENDSFRRGIVKLNASVLAADELAEEFVDSMQGRSMVVTVESGE